MSSLIFAEGNGATYITGSGQTDATSDRVQIYETEGNVKPIKRQPRKRKQYDSNEDGSSTCDVELSSNSSIETNDASKKKPKPSIVTGESSKTSTIDTKKQLANVTKSHQKPSPMKKAVKKMSKGVNTSPELLQFLPMPPGLSRSSLSFPLSASHPYSQLPSSHFNTARTSNFFEARDNMGSIYAHNQASSIAPSIHSHYSHSASPSVVAPLKLMDGPNNCADGTDGTIDGGNMVVVKSEKGSSFVGLGNKQGKDTPVLEGIQLLLYAAEKNYIEEIRNSN